MSVLARERLSCHPCANLRAHTLEPDPPHAFPAAPLRSAASQASREDRSLGSSTPSGSQLRSRGLHGEKPPAGGPCPGRAPCAGSRCVAPPPPPRVCPTALRPLPLGRWGPGGVPSALHLHLEDSPRGDNQLCERGRARLGRGEEEGE